MKYPIKKLQFSDLKECARLYVKVFNGEPWNDHWTSKTALSRLKDIYDSPRFYGIKIVHDKRIAGVILGNIESWYVDYHYQLKEIYVDPDFQSKGMGRKLIKKAKEDLKRKRVGAIYLYTSSHKRLQGFYNRNGFSVLQYMKMMKQDMNLK